MKIAVCTMGKLENLYIREFVEHYLHIQFDKIFLYDNNDLDGEHFETVITDYIENGKVDLINWRGVEGGQQLAYQHCYNNYNTEYDWILFVDVDEFLIMNYTDNVHDFLENPCYKDYGCIFINWKIMNDGDKNLLFYDGTPLIERFDNENEDDGVNMHTKSFVRGGMSDIIFDMGTHSPRKSCKVCDCEGNNIEDINNILYGPNYKNAYIKHFIVKTPTEYLLLKKQRLNSDLSKEEAYNRLSEGFYFAFSKRTPEKEAIYKKYLDMLGYTEKYEDLNTKKVAVLFISNQISNEDTNRVKVIQDSLNNTKFENTKYDVFWCYDKEDEFYHVTSQYNNINFFICTQEELKTKYKILFYNELNNFNVSLITCVFAEAHPEYDYIWTIEDDVIIKNNRWDYLFEGLNDNESDLLCSHIANHNWSFFDRLNHLSPEFSEKWEMNMDVITQEYNIQKWLSGFLCINRLSKKAVRFVNDYFKKHTGFFETIIPTILHENGFIIEDMSNPYSDFTKQENRNRYYKVFKHLYADYLNNGLSTISFHQRIPSSITMKDIPDGTLIHPVKWWEGDCFNQDSIILHNLDEIDEKRYTNIDKYFVINCITNDRNQNIVNDALIDTFGKENVYIYETCILPKHYKLMMGKSEELLSEATIGQIGCCLSHYMVIKLAYNRGYNNIIIFEDDSLLIGDKEKVKNHINNIPIDADIIKFAYGPDLPNQNAVNNFNNVLYNTNDEFVKNNDKYVRTWGAWAYYLSRNGMKAFIEYYDSSMIAADLIFNDFDYINKLHLNYYLSNLNNEIVNKDYMFSCKSIINTSPKYK